MKDLQLADSVSDGKLPRVACAKGVLEINLT